MEQLIGRYVIRCLAVLSDWKSKMVSEKVGEIRAIWISDCLPGAMAATYYFDHILLNLGSALMMFLKTHIFWKNFVSMPFQKTSYMATKNCGGTGDSWMLPWLVKMFSRFWRILMPYALTLFAPGGVYMLQLTWNVS